MSESGAAQAKVANPVFQSVNSIPMPKPPSSNDDMMRWAKDVQKYLESMKKCFMLLHL